MGLEILHYDVESGNLNNLSGSGWLDVGLDAHGQDGLGYVGRS